MSTAALVSGHDANASGHGVSEGAFSTRLCTAGPATVRRSQRAAAQRRLRDRFGACTSCHGLGLAGRLAGSGVSARSGGLNGSHFARALIPAELLRGGQESDKPPGRRPLAADVVIDVEGHCRDRTHQPATNGPPGALNTSLWRNSVPGTAAPPCSCLRTPGGVRPGAGHPRSASRTRVVAVAVDLAITGISPVRRARTL